MGANMSPGEPACPLIPPVQISGATSLRRVGGRQVAASPLRTHTSSAHGSLMLLGARSLTKNGQEHLFTSCAPFVY